MAILNTILSSLSATSTFAADVSRPFGLWQWLILEVFGGIKNYGLRIIVFILVLKIVLLPLDIFQRYKMRKNAKITEELKPHMDKLKRQYADDPRMLSSKQMELNRKSGYSYFSSCIPMVLTLVIFISLFSAMRSISQYMIFRQYVGWYDTYVQAMDDYEQDNPDFLAQKLAFEQSIATYVATIEDLESQLDVARDLKIDYTQKLAILNAGGQLDPSEMQGKTIEQLIVEYEALCAQLDIQIEDLWAQIAQNITSLRIVEADLELRLVEAVSYAQDMVVKYNDEHADSFLWIKSLWQPDVMWKAPIHESKSSFTSSVGDYADLNKDKGDIGTEELAIMLARYDDVTQKLVDSPDNKQNGWLVLVILSFLFSAGSQMIMQRLQKKSGQFDSGAGINSGVLKFMMFVMPAIMAYFAIQYTAAFALYMVANSGMTILINVITTLSMNKYDKHAKVKAESVVISYGRPDPNKFNQNKK